MVSRGQTAVPAAPRAGRVVLPIGKYPRAEPAALAGDRGGTPLFLLFCRIQFFVTVTACLGTAQTRQRLFFPICDHSSRSFAVENNWRRPHLPERPSKIGIWIEKFRCQNSNLNLPTIKNGFCGYSYLKDPLRIMKRI